jgi:hypothetical protein
MPGLLHCAQGRALGQFFMINFVMTVSLKRSVYYL